MKISLFFIFIVEQLDMGRDYVRGKRGCPKIRFEGQFREWIRVANGRGMNKNRSWKRKEERHQVLREVLNLEEANNSSKSSSQDEDIRNEGGVDVRKSLKTNNVSKASEEGITRGNESSLVGDIVV